MRKIYYILIILLVVLVFDFSICAVSKGLIWNAPDVGVNQTNSVQALLHRKAEVLVLGPSTANHHFDTRILEDSLKMKAYNAGFDGQNMVYCAMVFHSFLNRCTPKLVIADVGSPVMDNGWMSHLSDMNCFYGMNESVDSIIDDVSSKLDEWKLESSLYRYNNSWQWLLHAYTAHSKADLDGYRPMPVNETTNFKAVYKPISSFVVDSVNLKYLNGIVKECKAKKIRLILNYSPCLVIAKNDMFRNWLKRYCSIHGIMLTDYSGDKRFVEHPELFYDMSHLNSEGAKIFTKDFIGKIFR